MKKIVIIGLGLGGLAFVHNLPYDPDLDITIYEKEKYEDLGYPWCDSVSYDGIASAGIILPNDVYHPKKLFNMYSPDMGGSVPQRQKTVDNGVELDRKAFLRYMIECASHKATIHYGIGVKRLIIKEGVVVGLKLENGKKVFADLVIDASGPLSLIKNDVISPLDKLGADDILSGYRAIFKPNKGVLYPDEDSVYLKHLNHVGVSWCRTTPDGNLDVFISEITDKLKLAHIALALKDIREKNPILSDELIEERFAKLVVKRPLSRFVYDGYVLVGDSAYMSTPTSGSGIENALRAGRILAEVFLDAKGNTTADLWHYQTRFMRSIGSSLYAKDLFRRYAQTLPVEEVNWFFSTMFNGFKEFTEADYDSVKRMKVYEYAKKAKALLSNKPLFSSGTRIANLALKAKLHAFMLPVEFEKESFLLWQERYAKILEEGDENSYVELLNEEAAADKASIGFEDIQDKIRELIKRKRGN